MHVIRILALARAPLLGVAPTWSCPDFVDTFML